MYDINTVTVSGNLTGPPKINVLEEGGQVLNFQIANDNLKKHNGVYEKYTNFFSISVFGNKCNWLYENLKTGSRVAISGQLVFNQWKNEDGNKRNKLEIHANNVIVCG